MSELLGLLAIIAIGLITAGVTGGLVLLAKSGTLGFCAALVLGGVFLAAAVSILAKPR